MDAAKMLELARCMGVPLTEHDAERTYRDLERRKAQIDRLRFLPLGPHEPYERLVPDARHSYGPALEPDRGR